MVKRHWFTLLFVVLLALVVFLPPLIHGYVYPSGGDDTARHLWVIDQVNIGQFTYLESEFYHRYGAQTLTGWLCDLSGLDTDTFFLWFNYVVLFAMGLVVFYVVRRLTHNGLGAAISAALALFGVGGTMILFGCGTIYNILNMYVFGLVAILLFVLWLAGKGTIYGLLALLGFAWCAVMHSVTALYITLAIPLALGAVLVYRLAMWQSVRSLVAWGLAFIPLGVVLPYFALRDAPWILEQATGAGNGIPEIVEGNQISWIMAVHPTVWEYVIMVAPLLIGVGIVIAAIVMWRKQIKWPAPVRYMMLVLGSFIVVLACGTWLDITPDNYRFAVDLSIMLAILTGLVLANVMVYEAKRVLVYYALPIILAVCIPMGMYWFSYTSCVYPADLQAIEYINSNGYSESKYCVEVSSQVAPWIYGRFTNGICYVTDGGQVAIWRSEAMTCITSPDMEYFWRDRESQLADYDWMPLLASFNDGKVEVRLYDTNFNHTYVQ